MPEVDNAPPVQPAPAPAPAALVPLELPAACFAASAPIVKLVPFKFGPYTYAGRDWSGLGIRRLSVEQIAAVFANYRANLAIDPAFPLSMPVYVDEQGSEVPAGLLEKLDPEARDDVEEAAPSFLPRRYRVVADPGSPSPSTGARTEPSSSA